MFVYNCKYTYVSVSQNLVRYQTIG